MAWFRLASSSSLARNWRCLVLWAWCAVLLGFPEEGFSAPVASAAYNNAGFHAARVATPSENEQILMEEVQRLRALQKTNRGGSLKTPVLIVAALVLGFLARWAVENYEKEMAAAEAASVPEKKEKKDVTSDELAAAQAKLSTLRRENAELKTKFERSEFSLNEAQLQLLSLKTENMRLEEAIKKHGEEREERMKEYSKALAELREATLEVQSLTESNTKLQARVEGMSIGVENLERELHSTERELSDMMVKRQLLLVEREALLARVESLLVGQPQAEERKVEAVVPGEQLVNIRPVEFFVSQDMPFPLDEFARREVFRFVERSVDAREAQTMATSTLLPVVMQGLSEIARSQDGDGYIMGRVLNSQQGFLVANDVPFTVEAILGEAKGRLHLLVKLHSPALERNQERSKLRSTTMTMVVSVQPIRASSEAAVNRLSDGAAKAMDMRMRAETRVANDLEGPLSSNVHAVYDCGVDGPLLLGTLGSAEEGGVSIERDGQKFVMHTQVLLKDASLGSVEDAIAEAGRLGVPLPSLHAKEYIARKVVSILAQFHVKGMVHGEISLHAFRVTTDGAVLLTGIEHGNDVRREGIPANTHLAPEVVADAASRRGKWRATTLADSWSAGVSLFRLFTGRLPYTNADGQSLVELLDGGNEQVASNLQIFGSAIEPARVLRASGVNEDWVQIISALLSPEKAHRPSLQQVLLAYPYLFGLPREEPATPAPPSQTEGLSEDLFHAKPVFVEDPSTSEDTPSDATKGNAEEETPKVPSSETPGVQPDGLGETLEVPYVETPDVNPDEPGKPSGIPVEAPVLHPDGSGEPSGVPSVEATNGELEEN